MADSSSKARRGGSSKTLSSALAPSSLSSSTASMTAMRQPPSPAVEPKNETDRRTSSTAMSWRNLPVSPTVRSSTRRSRLRLRCDTACDRMIGRRPQATPPTAPRPRPGPDGRARSAPYGRRASPCRSRAVRRSARHAACARCGRRRAMPARRPHARTARSSAVDDAARRPLCRPGQPRETSSMASTRCG